MWKRFLAWVGKQLLEAVLEEADQRGEVDAPEKVTPIRRKAVGKQSNPGVG